MVGVVERWISFGGKLNAKGLGGVRKDLFGIFDLVAMGHKAIWGVQSTSLLGRESHLKTLLVDQKENSLNWIDNTGRILLVCWETVKGEKRNSYIPHVQEIIREGETIGVQDLFFP